MLLLRHELRAIAPCQELHTTATVLKTVKLTLSFCFSRFFLQQYRVSRAATVALGLVVAVYAHEQA